MATRTDRVQVIFEVGGDGKLKASLHDVGKAGGDAAAGLDKASASQARMISAAKTAGAVLGTGFVAVMGLVIKNTMEAERVDAQLEARLKSTAGAAGMTKQALDELATATARKTTFDDESVKSAEAMLLTFTKVHADVFPKAIEAITDMATAMGTDLESATLQLGKALNDPIQGISALQRVGVSFTADQKAVIKSLVETGQQAEAQRLILRELETEFGGAAVAARDTFGGALQALKNTLGDLTEGSGGSLKDATKAVNDLTETLNEPSTKAGFDSVTAAIFSLLGVVAKVPAGFQMMGEFIGSSLAVLREEASITADLLKQVASFGMADGTISDVVARSKANSLQYRQVLEDMVLRNHNMTREQYNNQFAAQFDLGLPGVTRAPVLPVSSDFNFAADMASRSAAARTGTSGGGGGKSATGGGSRGQMPDFYAATVADIQREIEEAARLDDRWKSLAATLAGPLASAEYEHQQNLREIETLGKQAGASSEQIARAKEQETARYRDEAAAIQERLDPTRALIRDMEFELELLGLGNNEREREILLRRAGGQATEEQRQRVGELVKQLQDAREKEAFKDDLKDLFVDIGMNVDDASSAVEHFFDTLKRRALQALAENLIGKLFPAPQSGEGSSSSGGGWMSAIGSILGGLFGGGRASGGSVSGGSLYEVAERGQPEVFEQNGKRYLIPGGAGWVTPAVPLGGGAATGGGAAGGYGAVTINNYGNPNGVRTEERTGPDGMRELLVFVQETAVNAVAADVQKGGKVAKAGQGAYGWQRQGVVRG